MSIFSDNLRLLRIAFNGSFHQLAYVIIPQTPAACTCFVRCNLKGMSVYQFCVSWSLLKLWFGRGFLCRWVYTATEAFTRILLQHAMLGRDPISLNWCEYATRKKRADTTASWFTLEPATQMVVDNILKFAVFDQIVVFGYPTNQRRTSTMARGAGAQPWMAYKLRSGQLRPKYYMLAPFEARGSREESATRLALEAQRLGVPWNALAVRQESDASKDADVEICSCTMRKRSKLQPCLS
jgi:hypothetical protein